MSKDSKRLRKELRRFAHDKVQALNPRDVIDVFIEEALSQGWLKRVRLGLGLIVKWRKLLPINLYNVKKTSRIEKSINERREQIGLPPILFAAGNGEVACGKRDISTGLS
jgi:hypothetical protein